MAAAVSTTEWPCRCLEQERADARRASASRLKPEAYSWRATHGCDAEAARPVGEFDGVPQRRCLRAVVDEQQPDAFTVVRLAEYASHGNLPEPGGALDQAAPLLDAIELVQAAMAEGRAVVAARESETDYGDAVTGRRASKRRMPKRKGRR